MIMNSGSSTEAIKLDNQQKSETYFVGNKYRLVLKDAYWIKDNIKVRFVPHQMEHPLTVIFAKVLDNNEKTGRDESELEFKLKFEIPGTIFPESKEITIRFDELTPMYCIKKGKICFLTDKDDNQYYKYFLKEFSSDLVGGRFN